MTVTRCPHAIQRAICPYRFVPVPPPWGWVQSRSVRTRMCRPSSIRAATVAGDTLARSMARSPLIVAALVCALATPSAALAQGAGDDQYQDPFGDEQSQAAPTPTATPAPSQPAPSQAAPAPTATPSAAQAPSQPAPAPAPAPASAEELPRTGADAAWLAIAGVALLAAGLALRRADHER